MNAKGKHIAVVLFAIIMVRAPCGELFPDPQQADVKFPVGEAVMDWAAPPPEEGEILDIDGNLAKDTPESRRKRTIMRYGGLAGIVSGLLLSGVGAGYIFSSSGSDQDPSAIHEGILMIISGSLVSALSSVITGAAISTR